MNFSVIIPYYKALKTIGRTLDSVFHQTHSDFEVIVVNDLSPDDPRSLMQDFNLKFSQRNIKFTYIELEKNGGPSRARNIAWDFASGDYVAFLDSDDMWHPQKLEICARFIQKDTIMLFHDAEITNDNEWNIDVFQKLDPQIYTCSKTNKLSWFKKNYSVTPAVILKKGIECRFNEQHKYSEDYELWLRITFKYDNTYKVVGFPLTYLGKPFSEGNGLSSNITKMRIGEMKLFIQFCLSNIIYLPLLPLLLFYSLLKHLRLLSKSIF